MTPVSGKSFAFKRRFKCYYQFRISLEHIEPEIWRRIQVPEVYNFWDLHVAITDCMPWLDYHLHVFRIKNPKTKRIWSLGIPDDDGELDHKPGWDYNIEDFFTLKNNECLYEYDFGDGWMHKIVLEGIHLKEDGITYPRCTEGKRACPPEDCGGDGGYQRFLDIIRDPKHEEHKSMLDWAKMLTGKYPFDPEDFTPSQLHFDDPSKRWAVAFNGARVTPDLRCYSSQTRLQT